MKDNKQTEEIAAFLNQPISTIRPEGIKFCPKCSCLYDHKYCQFCGCRMKFHRKMTIKDAIIKTARAGTKVCDVLWWYLFDDEETHPEHGKRNQKIYDLAWSICWEERSKE